MLSLKRRMFRHVVAMAGRASKPFRAWVVLGAPRRLMELVWDRTFTAQFVSQHSALRWVDRSLVKLGCPPRLLSSTVMIPPLDCEPTPRSAFGGFQSLLWTNHSTSTAFAIFLNTASILGLACWLAARVWPLSPAVLDPGPTLNTLAQVAGGVFATIVTVVVFAIGLTSQRPGTWIYMPFVARRHHVFVIAAFCAGVGLVDAVYPSISDLTGTSALRYLLWAHVALMPVIVGLTLWLMCQVIESASGSDVSTTLEVFRSAMRRQAEIDRTHDASAGAFLSRLRSTGIEFDYWAGRLGSTAKGAQRVVGKSSDRTIIDIDREAMDRLVAICQPLAQHVAFSLLGGPTVRGSKGGILHISLRQLGAQTSALPVDEARSRRVDAHITAPSMLSDFVTEAQIAQLEQVTESLFVYGDNTSSSEDLRQFFERMQSELQRAARAGDVVSLKARFEDYREFLRAWLEIAGPGTVPNRPSLFLPVEPRFVGPLEVNLAEVIRSAAQSEDAASYGALVDWLFAIVAAADDHDAAGLFREAAHFTALAYYLASKTQALRDGVRTIFDAAAEGMLMRRPSLRRLSGNASPTAHHTPAESAKRFAVIGSLLSMIRYAVEAGDELTANMLLDRLSRNAYANGRRSNRMGVPSTADEGEALVTYAFVVVIGWSLLIVRRQSDRSDAARSAMKRALTLVPSQHYLVALWEIVRGESSTENKIDTALEVSHWELRSEEHRSGIVHPSTWSEGWLEDGFWLAMLHAPRPHATELRGYFRAAPRRWLWKSEGLSARLDQIHTAAHGVPPADSSARDSVVELVTRRERVAEASALRSQLNEPISANRQFTLRTEITQSLANHRTWWWAMVPHVLTSSSHVSHRAATHIFHVHRDYLIENNNWAAGYGNFIAEDLATYEALELVHRLETTLDTGTDLASLVQLAASVRKGVEVLRSRGMSPNLLIVPPQNRFACALFRRPLWDKSTGRRSEWGESSVGTWEGLNVVRCPYANTGSVIIADAAAAFVRNNTTPQPPDVKIEDLDEKAKESMLARMTDDGVEPLPSTNDIRVKVTVSLLPSVEITTRAAAYKIDVSHSDGCYAMEPGDTVYHRSTCPEIEGAEDIELSLGIRLEGEPQNRTPCDICKPATWDGE